jgi:hypothetical protein
VRWEGKPRLISLPSLPPTNISRRRSRRSSHGDAVTAGARPPPLRPAARGRGGPRRHARGEPPAPPPYAPCPPCKVGRRFRPHSFPPPYPPPRLPLLSLRLPRPLCLLVGIWPGSAPPGAGSDRLAGVRSNANRFVGLCVATRLFYFWVAGTYWMFYLFFG